ncbi:MAG: hypothetical protein CMD81_13600 [Gammaproteobacteria bacterium]|nr:hypothetical protein [Gammaproteobacteria bacterium]HBF08632.1 hypothetical protein [Gammaproteobacteria bacterium]
MPYGNVVLVETYFSNEEAHFVHLSSLRCNHVFNKGLTMNDIHKDVKDFEAAGAETGVLENTLGIASYDEILTREELSNIFTLLIEEFNVDFSQFKLTTVVRQVHRLMGVNELDTLDSYYELLRNNSDALVALKNALLVNVSSFFRDTDAFEQLGKSVIAKLLQKTSEDHTIRIWSVGCSTGEEAISIAIQFFEEMEVLNIKRQIRIFATDVDDEALKIAKQGIYPSSITNDVPQHILLKYFEKDGDSYLIKSAVRRSILFARHNIMKDPAFSKLDLISCRNTLIYFIPSMQRQILSVLTCALKDYGYLFTGMSESVHGFSYYYDVVHDRSRLYCKTKRPSLKYTNTHSHLASNPFTGHSQQFRSSLYNLENNASGTVEHEQLLSYVIQSSINPQLLSVWMPPSVLIDSHGRVVYIYGDIAPFVSKVSSGRVMNYYKSFLRKSLAVVVENAIERAIETNEIIQLQNIQLSANSPSDLDKNPSLSEKGIVSENIDIRVDTLASNDFDEMFSVVTFSNYRVNSDVVLDEFKPVHREKILEYSKALKRIEVLEHELQQSREYLKLTVEELEVTNEELQTSNEELLSANEELQSMNEELNELNGDYQDQISTLETSNQDNLQLLNAANLAVIFLDIDLKIKGFTAEAGQYFNIVTQDVGRPLHHFSHQLSITELPAQLDEVLAGSTVKLTTTLANNENRQVHICLRPYKVEEKVMGVVITIYPLEF